VLSTYQQYALRIPRHLCRRIPRRHPNLFQEQGRTYRTRTDGSQITITTRLVSRPQKMRLALERSRVPRMPSWKKRSKDKPKKD
jgi:hypothetical protein